MKVELTEKEVRALGEARFIKTKLKTFTLFCIAVIIVIAILVIADSLDTSRDTYQYIALGVFAIWTIWSIKIGYYDSGKAGKQFLKTQQEINEPTRS